MKSKHLSLAVAALFTAPFLFASVSSVAQTSESEKQQAAEGEPGKSEQSSENFLTQQEESQFTAERLMDMSVVNEQGEEIAEINDLVVDQDGKVAGVILSIGGFLGLGEKEVGIPWKQVSLKPQERQVVINLNKEQLEQAPAFRSRQEVQAEQRWVRAGQTQVSGTVQSVDREQGIVTVSTGAGDMQLRLPPEQLGGLQEGDPVNISVQLPPSVQEPKEPEEKQQKQQEIEPQPSAKQQDQPEKKTN